MVEFLLFGVNIALMLVLLFLYCLYRKLNYDIETKIEHINNIRLQDIKVKLINIKSDFEVINDKIDNLLIAIKNIDCINNLDDVDDDLTTKNSNMQ